MGSGAGDDPAGDVGRQEDPDSLDFVAMTNLESPIRLTWRENAEDWVGSGVPAWAGREVPEDKGLGGNDEELLPVSSNSS